MDYQQYDAYDFSVDDAFIQWVQEPDETSKAFWQKFVELYPHKRPTLEQARALVLAALALTVEEPSVEQQRRVFQRIRPVLSEDSEPQQPGRVLSFLPRWKWTTLAASLLLLAGIGWGLFYQLDAASSPNWPALAGTNLIEKHNTTNQPLVVLLEDGSSVVLQPHTRLRYPIRFAQQQRRVYLDGEAFFEVAKDADRPFIVRAHELVTTVWGTSFNIRAYEQERQVTVRVKTGKVSLQPFQAEEKNLPAADREPRGLLLMPKQQATYLRDAAQMTTPSVELPGQVTSRVQSQNFNFVDTPVDTVFHALEQAYGVHIHYNEKRKQGCLLTAVLSDEPLLNKLKLICEVIEAQYQIVDGNFIIRGGCQP